MKSAFGINMVWSEGFDLLPVGESFGPLCFGKVGDGDGFIDLPFGLLVLFRWGLDCDVVALFVKAGGKESKVVVLEGEAVTPFMDAAFAKDELLCSVGSFRFE